MEWQETPKERNGDTSLKCVYKNGYNLRNKQEEQKLHVQSQNYNVVGITEMCKDSLHKWSMSVNGNKLFRKRKEDEREGCPLW